MGSCYEHQCKRCGYSATVSGGHDMGMSSASSTYACKKCGELQDIGYSTDEDETEEETSPACCKRCGSQNLVKWNTGDACPKCGGKMIRGGKRISWD
jgi:DNA-directed RNA polymerase subunit RPC12/RpoP